MARHMVDTSGPMLGWLCQRDMAEGSSEISLMACDGAHVRARVCARARVCVARECAAQHAQVGRSSKQRLAQHNAQGPARPQACAVT
jgi:hypothetical protein